MSTPFELQTGQAVGVTRHILNQVMALQDGSAALFFCYLLAHPEPLDFEQAEFTLGLTEKELKRVFILLRDSGLLSPLPSAAPPPSEGQLSMSGMQERSGQTVPPAQAEPAAADTGIQTPESRQPSDGYSAAPVEKNTPPAEVPPVEPPVAPKRAEVAPPRGLEPGERPSYNSSQITSAMRDNSDFRDVVREAESRLGKVLSPSDLQTLFGMYDWRGLPPGVLSLLITHCVEEARANYGPGRPPTMKQIDREAAAWEREGVDTEARAEAHLAELAERRELRGEILSTLQIRGRAPSATEERYIRDWVQSNLSIELIALAYDKTVVRTGGMSWKYMDTILKSWLDKRLTTPEEVESGDVRKSYTAPSTVPKKTRAVHTSREPEQTAGQHERDAVEDMRDFLRRLREDQSK